MPIKAASLYLIPILLLARAAAAADDVTPDQVVGALESSFGVHPGERRNHIKGTCAAGEFVGNPEMASFSRSSLFSGKPVPVVARFSVAGGNPKAPDTAKTPRGMALEFRLPEGRLQHITMINTPVFGVRTPRDFLDLTLATRPDPATGKPDPDKVKAFRAAHPENKAQTEYLDTHNPPASYAASAYFGLHTFRFIGKDGKATLVRWQFVPQDGERSLTDAEVKAADPNFLEPTLIKRAQQGPIRWDMIVAIGQPGDPETDPTQAWPANRRRIKAGTLTLTSAMPQKGAACEPINYDPLVMADGIEPTDDPVLKFRSPAYAVSAGRRQAGK
ncbi:MAG TPA: catalase family peroxidase [Rhodocyclaceae bacterium]|nr:catalase family peroxidase [Rhodocyclaceae bacterium]